MVFTIRTTIEVLGYPEDHVKEVMDKVIEKLKKEEGFQILKEEINKPEKVKETFFASFAELEIKLNDFSKLIHFCYDYLPSGLEVLDTEKVTLPIREFSSALNEMLAKLHNYNIVLTNLSSKLESLEKENKT